MQSLETHCMTLLLFRPEAVYDLERELKTSRLEKFTPNDFVSVENQTICRLLLAGLDQDEHDVLPYMKANLPVELGERFQSLLTGELYEHANPTKVQQDLVRVLVNLRLINMNTVLSQLRFLQEDPELSDEEKGELGGQILKLTIARGKLDRVMVKPTIKKTLDIMV